MIPTLCVCSETETSVSSALANLEQGEEGSGDEDSGCENLAEPGGVMDFSAAAIAEQLTQTDSVRERIYYVPHLLMSAALHC